jgi:ribosomal protein S18 acetylase RimI-like enzyme
MSTAIRKAVVEDLPALATLLVDVNNSHAEALPHIYRKIVADDQTETFLHRILEEAGSHLFVAEEAAQLVGYVSLRLVEAPSTPVHVPRRWVTIDTVVVREAFRHRGIGAALVEHVHTWARDQGLNYVELTVAEFNTVAIAFYEKLGYTTVIRRMGRFLSDRTERGQ